MKGFQSSVDPRIHLGLGKASLDSLVIRWPNGRRSFIAGPLRNQSLTLPAVGSHRNVGGPNARPRTDAARHSTRLRTRGKPLLPF